MGRRFRLPIDGDSFHPDSPASLVWFDQILALGRSMVF